MPSHRIGSAANLARSCLTLAAIILFLAGFYYTLLRPTILTWGATPAEAVEALPGDELAPYISSTRAVTIDAAPATVWAWLVQLGADRAGFYSYGFIEEPLYDYRSDEVNRIVPEFQGMEVGRVISAHAGSPSPDSPDSWLVVAVEPGQWMVLRGWGAFVVRGLDDGRARLIVRTHGWPTPGLLEKLGYFVMMPLHYIMERKMMLGIKERAEAGGAGRASGLLDLAWVALMLVGALGVAAVVLVGQGVRAALVATALGAAWLVCLLIAPPRPLYGLLLLAAMAASLPLTRGARQGRLV